MDCRCGICGAGFERGVLKNGLCPTCISEHGGMIDIEELRRKNNPELFPLPKYITAEHAEEIAREVVTKMVKNTSLYKSIKEDD